MSFVEFFKLCKSNLIILVVLKVVGKLNYISIQNNILVVCFPKGNPKQEVLDILYSCVSIIRENEIKNIILHLNQSTPSISDANLLALLKDTFYAVPFPFKVALVHPKVEDNLQTRFIAQMCLSKGILISFCVNQQFAYSWLETERLPELAVLNKKMSN